MKIKNWRKSELQGSSKWYHENGGSIEIWQRGNRIFPVYYSRHGSLEKITLGEFKSGKEALKFAVAYMKKHTSW